MVSNFNNRIRQVLLLLVLAALIGIVFSELYLFFPGFLGAITLYILCREWYAYLTVQKKWNKAGAAFLFMFGFLICIGLPVYFTVDQLSPRINGLIENPEKINNGLRSVSAQVKKWTGQELLSANTMLQLQKKLNSGIPALLNSTALILSNLAMLLFLAYFMFTNGKQMEKTIHQFIPLRNRNIDMLADETRNMVKANAIGIPLISIIQGFFALLGYWMFGVTDYILWGFITGVFAFFPVIGTMLIWVPMVLYVFSTGSSGQGIGLAIYSAVVTGNVDYFARITLLKKLGNVHPVVTVLGVIVGLGLFGFWGFIFGPLLISYSLLLFRIYTSEFGSMHTGDDQFPAVEKS